MTYEDFTTYTEVDPNNHITIGPATHVEAKTYQNETAYLYKDKGANHFADFTHYVDVQFLDESGLGWTYPWALMNTIENIKACKDNHHNAIYLRLYGYTYLELMESYNGTEYYQYCYIDMNTWYYLTIQKNGTSLTCKIYTDSARTNLLTTLSLTLHNNDNYEFVFVANTYNQGSASWGRSYTDNLDLCEEAPPTSKSFADSGGVSDVFNNPFRAMGFSDTGHGAEAFIALLQKVFADSGLGSDAFSKELYGFFDKAFSDIGSAVDAFAIPFKALQFLDVGYGSDVFSKLITLLNKAFSDAGYGADAFIIGYKELGFSDAVHGSDGFFILLWKDFSDIGGGSDVFENYVIPVIQKAFADAGIAADVFAKKNVIVIMLPSIIGMTMDGQLVITLKRKVEAET